MRGWVPPVEEVDRGRGHLDGAEETFQHRVGCAGHCDHAAVVVPVAAMVQQRDPGRLDGSDDGGYHLWPSAFGEILGELQSISLDAPLPYCQRPGAWRIELLYLLDGP